MSSIRNTLLGRFAGLESDVPENGGATGLEVGEVVDEAGAQIDGENLPEGDILAAADDQDVIDEGVDEVDTLVETSEALESFLAAAQTAGKQGGWTAQEAAAYSLGIDATTKRVGLNAKSFMPSVESFGSSGRERINATGSVENRITEILKNIWEAIKKAINKVVVFIRKWYLKIFDGASRLKKRAEAIGKRSQNTNGSVKESKIRTGVLGALHNGRKDIDSSLIISSIETTKDIIASMTKGKLASAYGDNADALVTALGEVTDAAAASAVTEAITAVKDAGNRLVSAAKVDGLTADGDKTKYANLDDVGVVEVKQTTALAGGKVIQVVNVAANNATGTDGAKAGAKIAKYTGLLAVADAVTTKVEIDESKEVKTLAIGDCTKIADAVVAFCDVVIDFKAGFESYERKTKEVMKKVDSLASKSGKHDDVEGLTAADKGVIVRELANAIGMKVKNQGQSITNLINYGMGVSRAGLVYANSSLNQYKD